MASLMAAGGINQTVDISELIHFYGIEKMPIYNHTRC